MHNDIHTETKTTHILSFEKKHIIPKHRGRGRPKNTIPRGNDYGTPELAMKRALSLTVETLDLCLERQLIEPQQHWCGIHLRWLFTLRNGAPGITALDLTHVGGITPKTDDPDWRSNREKEYRDAIHALAMGGHVSTIINICIYNDRPPFLNIPQNSEQLKRASQSLAGFRHGLDILVQHWNRETQMH